MNIKITKKRRKKFKELNKNVLMVNACARRLDTKPNIIKAQQQQPPQKIPNNKNRSSK